MEKLWIQGCGCHHSQHSHNSHQTGNLNPDPNGSDLNLFVPIYPNLFIPIYPNLFISIYPDFSAPTPPWMLGLDTGMWLPPFSAFPHFPSNRESPAARPQCGLRSQFIHPDLSRFFCSNSSSLSLARPFPGIPLPEFFPAPFQPEIHAGSLYQLEQRSSGFLGAALAQRRERRNPWIWGAPEQLPPKSGDFFFFCPHCRISGMTREIGIRD